jgi:hypothetical protein
VVGERDGEGIGTPVELTEGQLGVEVADRHGRAVPGHRGPEQLQHRAVLLLEVSRGALAVELEPGPVGVEGHLIASGLTGDPLAWWTFSGAAA